MDKCQKSNPTYAGSGYGKLRAFAGNQPVPASKESFEEWLEQTMQVLDEWGILQTQEKQRIAESLRGLS